jgi:hypothetical protein
MTKRLAGIVLLLALALAAEAAAETRPEPPLDVGVDEKLGQSVPLDLVLVDGRASESRYARSSTSRPS